MSTTRQPNSLDQINVGDRVRVRPKSGGRRRTGRVRLVWLSCDAETATVEPDDGTDGFYVFPAFDDEIEPLEGTR